MNLSIFLFALLLCCGRYSNGASIGDGVTVEDFEAAGEELLPSEGQLEVLEAEPVVAPDEIIGLEPDEPKLSAQILADEEVPLGLNNMEEEVFPMDAAPVLGEPEFSEITPDIVDEESAIRAERQADEDLLKALDNVLAKKETLEDVIKSEDLSLA